MGDGRMKLEKDRPSETSSTAMKVLFWSVAVKNKLC